MNCDGKMSFGDFVFPNNPQQIRITRSRTVTEQRALTGDAKVNEYGKGARKITGEGEFFGEDCIYQFSRLRERFEKGGGGILYIPSQRPVLAYSVTRGAPGFTSLWTRILVDGSISHMPACPHSSNFVSKTKSWASTRASCNNGAHMKKKASRWTRLVFAGARGEIRTLTCFHKGF